MNARKQSTTKNKTRRRIKKKHNVLEFILSSLPRQLHSVKNVPDDQVRKSVQEIRGERKPEEQVSRRACSAGGGWYQGNERVVAKQRSVSRMPMHSQIPADQTGEGVN